jgi:hypothetical protein
MLSPRIHRIMQSYCYGIFQVEIGDSKYALPYLAQVVEALKRLMTGCTASMIAHSLGTLAHCDAQLEIEDGRVIKFEGHVLATSATTKVPKPQHQLKGSS